MIVTPRDIADLVGTAAFSGELALTRDRRDFAPAFWDLRSGLLGELAQKLVNYRVALTLTGDFRADLAASRALRDFFRENVAAGPIRLATHPVIPD